MAGTISGTLYKNKKTKALVKQLPRGAIALLQHRDLDRLAAETLLERQVKAVINTAPSLTGRFPASGAALLLAAGVPLLDAGPQAWDRLRHGSRVTIDLPAGVIRQQGRVVATASVWRPPALRRRLASAERRLRLEWERFLDNTLLFAQREKGLLSVPPAVPTLPVSLAGRHALVVARGHHYRQDLRALLPYIRTHHPVLIGVDGGADALLALGLRPDLIVGDMDSVSDQALHAARALVVHAYQNGDAPGAARVAGLGLTAHRFAVFGTSEDAALLLAHELGARLIVAVGTHTNVIDTMEKGRDGLASTLLVRLKIGDKLIDAKGIGLLTAPARTLQRSFANLATAAVLLFGAATLLMPLTRGLLQLTWLSLRLQFGW